MIYRTENGCGWGVKTKDPIKKGQFAVEYVGEVISNDEAEERGKKYGERERTKLIRFVPWWSILSTNGAWRSLRDPAFLPFCNRHATCVTKSRTKIGP